MQRISKWNVLLDAMQVFEQIWAYQPDWCLSADLLIACLLTQQMLAPGHLLTSDACYWYPKPCHSTTYDSVACSQLPTQPKAILSTLTRLTFLKALPAYPSPNYFALTFIGVTSLTLTMPAYSVHQRAPLFIITPSFNQPVYDYLSAAMIQSVPCLYLSILVYLRYNRLFIV